MWAIKEIQVAFLTISLIGSNFTTLAFAVAGNHHSIPLFSVR
jgi:hypothetical protein